MLMLSATGNCKLATVLPRASALRNVSREADLCSKNCNKVSLQNNADNKRQQRIFGHGIYFTVLNENFKVNISLRPAINFNTVNINTVIIDRNWPYGQAILGPKLKHVKTRLSFSHKGRPPACVYLVTIAWPWPWPSDLDLNILEIFLHTKACILLYTHFNYFLWQCYPACDSENICLFYILEKVDRLCQQSSTKRNSCYT